MITTGTVPTFAKKLRKLTLLLKKQHFVVNEFAIGIAAVSFFLIASGFSPGQLKKRFSGKPGYSPKKKHPPKRMSFDLWY